MDILDVHTQVFKRFLCLDLSKADKLSRNNNGSYFAVKQQVVDLHHKLDLRVINDITFFLKLIPNILITIATKLLLENTFYILQDNSVINQFSILGNGHLTGFLPTNAISSLLVKTTAWNT
jgi:hypothetical protein